MARCDSIDIYQDVAEDAYRFGIGKTPLYYHEVGTSVIYAKMEYRNKYGSIKDRAGFFMISSGIKKGLLDRNKTIIEASSGNTGIALANIAKEMGYRAKIYVPNASSQATKDAIMVTGQEMVEVFDEASKHGSINIDTAVSMLKIEMEMKPGKYVNFDQYSNDANTLGHYYTSGPEVTSVIGDSITHVVISIGTGGTITGLAKYYKQNFPSVKVIAVMPRPYHKIQGLKNLNVSKTPEILSKNMNLIDEWMDIDDHDAEEMLKKMIDLELFTGLSSAANYFSAMKIAEKYPGSKVLTVFPDSAEKYREAYVHRQLFTDDEYNEYSAYFRKDPSDTLYYGK